MNDTETDRSRALDRIFITRALFVLAAIMIAMMVVELASVLVLVFGAVIVAVLLRAIMDPLRAHTPMPAPLCLGISVLLVAGSLIGIGVFFAIKVAHQADQLLTILPERIDALQGELQSSEFGRMVSGFISLDDRSLNLTSGTPAFLASAFGGTVSLIVVLAGGLYLSANPALYRDGLVALIPANQQARFRHALNASGRALNGWLIAQLMSMTVVGILTWLGLTLVGVPAATALGIFAFVAQFVPIIGPIVAAIPGILAASSVGIDTTLWAVGVYVLVQQLESNVITPFVQQRVVSLPMVLTMFSVVTFSALLGFVGMLFATPLAVVVFVLVKMLYVEDMLGHDIKVGVEEKTDGQQGDRGAAKS
ncbi:AI-2E family transporter [Henriciella aquimarina]|uniref:AI-2E family transporter n=1 Tax=Henriciella aquimarina TaxID=545261 RepID=UPI000A01F82D|nr:AI-2E family transporter [Henriciella aquimarina]